MGIIKYYLARDSGFKIQDSGFDIQDWKIKVWKCISRKNIKVCVHNIIRLLFHTKICALLRRGFTENSLSVAYCTFNVLEVITITPNRFKNQSGSTLKMLAHDCNHQKGLVKQKYVTLHHCGFKAEFPKNFY